MKAGFPVAPLVAALFCAGAFAPQPARTQTAFNRFGYCAPPTPPACVEQTDDASEKKLKACEADVERYVASVFSYRGCIATETERAVREANATIRKMRCARDPGFCPQAPAEAEPEAAKPRRKKK